MGRLGECRVRIVLTGNKFHVQESWGKEEQQQQHKHQHLLLPAMLASAHARRSCVPLCWEEKARPPSWRALKGRPLRNGTWRRSRQARLGTADWPCCSVRHLWRHNARSSWVGHNENLAWFEEYCSRVAGMKQGNGAGCKQKLSDVL
ncbi:hypothetical protein RRG08_052587 [Elysia crispata]|uniref:Uncharacterized protein n=1 Tax=Elysia crispata TaxID=231223 RepID=A0AAE1A1I3_9GAST|nr:hypothetical protein RRG08_052587 [Elysia crispata]